MILSSDVEPWLPGDWPKALATSPYMSTQSYIIFRAIIMLLFIGHFIAHLLEYFEEEGLMYWIYFSRWVTTLEVIEQVLSFSVVLWASQRLSSNAPNPPEVPVLVKVYIALLSMVLPSVLLSAGLYYALTPYWPPPYVSLFIHGGDVILLNLSFFMGRFPYGWNKMGWIGVLGVSYTVWTLIHFWLQIGTDDSAPCGRPLSECPIYAQLDWHHPMITGLLVGAGALLGPPVLGGLYTGLTKIRDNNDERAQEMRQAQLLRSMRPEEPEGGKPMEACFACSACA